MSYKDINMPANEFFILFMNTPNKELERIFKVSYHCMESFLKHNGISLTKEDRKARKDMNIIYDYGSLENYYRDRQEKKKIAVKNKYGIDNISQLPEQREIRSSLMKNNRASYEWNEKSITSKIERYGDANYSNRDRYKETCLKRYGVTNTFVLPEVKEKCRNSHTEESYKKQKRLHSKNMVILVFKILILWKNAS